MRNRNTFPIFIFTGLFLLSVLYKMPLQAQQHIAASSSVLPWVQKSTAANMNELPEKRNRFTKHYQLNNGSYKMISSVASLHYQTVNGWKEIDNDIQVKKEVLYERHPYVNESNSFKTYYPSQLLHDEIITTLREGEFKESIVEVYATDAEGNSFPFQPGACQTVELSEAVIQYKNIYPNMMARYTQQNDGRKFDLILQSAAFLDELPESAKFLVIKERLVLPETWGMKKSESGYDLYEGNTWLMHLQTPMAYDNALRGDAEKQHEGLLEVLQSGHDLFVSTIFSIDWLRDNHRQYPVYLDPTLTFYPDSVLYATGCNVASTGTKYSGTMGLSTAVNGVAWAKFNISTLPIGSGVTAGHYWGYHYAGAGSGSKTVTIRGFQYIDPMTAGSSSIQNQATLAGPLYDNNYIWGDNSPGWHGDTLFPNALNDITSQISQGWTAIGFNFNSGSTLSMDQYGYDAVLTSNKPYLELDYTLTPCSGTPNPGNTLANSLANIVTVCPGVPVYFTVQNATSLGSGVSYQWYRSSSIPGPGIPISGATNASLLYMIPGNSATFYCIVTCSGGGSGTSSVPVTVIVLPGNSPSCYCTSGASSSQDEDIFNVTLNGNSTDPLYSFGNGCTNVAPGPGSVLNQYASFLTLPPLAGLSPGTAVSFTIEQDECDGAPYYSNRLGIWIDFNHNASFGDPGEEVFIESVGASGPRTVSGTFVIPATALPGNTIIRFVCSEGTLPSPCGLYANGETEDYLVNIIPPSPCMLMVNPGNTMASVSGVCMGGTSSLSLQYPSFPSGIVSLQWYNTAGAIAGATNNTYNATITSNDTFYCVVTCLPGGFSYNAVPVSVQLYPSTAGTSSSTACDSYVWNGNTYIVSGVYTATFTNAMGCDSTHTLNLTINQSSSSAISLAACDSVQYNGTTYMTSGIYTQTFVNAVGCDSIVSINATVNNSVNMTLSLTGCDSVQYNGMTYTSDIVTIVNFTNAAGCDSIMNVQIIVNQSDSSSITQTGCDFYLFNGTVYTTSGNYTQTMTNANGCDSIIQLALTINQSTDSTINALSCNNYSFNGQTYTNTGNYTQNYTNAAGCDSIVNLQIAIDTLNVTITINGLTISTPNVGIYQWIDCNSNTPIPGATSLNFVPTTGGSYAVIVNAGACVDTSICLTMWLTGTGNTIMTGHSSVYPNPNQGIFDIELNEDGELTIMNDIGEIVLQKEASKGRQTIDISTSAKGIYFLRIKGRNETETLKLLKE